MRYKNKKVEVSNVKQVEDKGLRFDYEKIKVHPACVIIGDNEKIRDCR